MRGGKTIELRRHIEKRFDMYIQIICNPGYPVPYLTTLWHR